MPALGKQLIATLTKERLKKGGALALGYALGYLSHASGLF